MNLLRRTCLIENFYLSINNCFSLSTYSRVGKKSQPLFDKLLRTRFLLFLEHSDRMDKNNSEIIENKKSEIDGSAQKKNSPDYDLLVTSINALLIDERGSKYSLALIDDECCRILGKLSKTQILELLRILMRASNNITTLKCYKSLLLALRKYLEKGCLDVRETLALLFFQSLGKKLATKNVKLFMNFLPPLCDLTPMERCLVADSTFKCGVRLKMEDVKTLEKTLNDNAQNLIKDPPILGTICKALRLSGPTSDCSLENLSREILNNDERFSIMSAAHTLSLYAEASHENSRVTMKLFHDSMMTLSEDRRKLDSRLSIRIKDVDRLLWASAVLNYKLGAFDKNEISWFVERRYCEFEKKPFILVNTLLSLWILDCRLNRIIEKCLDREIFQLLYNESYLWKRLARLNLLINCIKIESPSTRLPDKLFPPLKVRMKIRKSVKSLHGIIEELKKKLNVRVATIDCPINGIYIAGVSLVGEKKLIHVDLLDDTTCFKSTKVPRGLTNLKIRLLAKIGFNSILITEEQSENVEFVSSTILKYTKDLMP